MPRKKPAKPLLPGPKGSREFSADAKDEFLRRLSDPEGRFGLGLTSVAAGMGYTRGAIQYWKTRDPNFRRRVESVQRNKSTTPPPVPDFKTWRASYVNIDEENPVTLRRQNVGETFGFMEPFVQALCDPETRRILTIWPIRHGKTKILEQLVVYELCKNPNVRILYFAGTETLAKDRIYAIQQMLTDVDMFPNLHATWGAWIGKPEQREKRWGATSFYVKGRNSTERDPSVRGMGIKTNVLGARADLIILDDVDTPQTSPEDRRKILRTINTAIRTRLNEGGRVVCIGNRCGTDDVYSHLMERPGWFKDVKSGINPDGTALCPQMYSIEELHELAADMSVEEFAMMVLNDPSPEGSSLFPPSLVDSAKRPVESAPPEWERIVMMDPAKTETSAIVALAHDRASRQMRAIDVMSKRNARHDGKMEMLLTFLARHKPTHVIIEDQGGSDSFCDVPAVKAAVMEAGAKLVRFHTGSNKHDPRRGMPLVATKLATEALTIAWGDPLSGHAADTQKTMRPLCEALIAYKPKATSHHGWHFDEAMALWFGVAWLEDNAPKVKHGTKPLIDPLAARRPFLRRQAPQLMRPTPLR